MMRRWLLLIALGLSGCFGGQPTTPLRSADLFGPRDVRLHPVFTKITSWQGDARPDGIEVLVELLDQFGDTCKGAGTFSFELFEFKRDQPDPRGRRLSNPWIVEVINAEQQSQRWSKTSRCYTFRLESDAVRRGGTYVLNVTFTPIGGPRVFNRVVLSAADS